jgi:phosphoribosylformylglycinamidine (FGAM) synthase-like enzyme
MIIRCKITQYSAPAEQMLRSFVCAPRNRCPTIAQPRRIGGLAATVDCNARYVYLNPYEGAKAAVAEAARNLSCVGATPLAVTDNLNFGSPEKPIGYWQLAEACRGLADACQRFETPVTGGNVSLYNETLDSQGNPQPIYPTPVVGMVGRIDDLTKTVGQGWRQPGDIIYLLGVPIDQTAVAQVEGHLLVTLGGSEFLATLHQQVTGHPPRVDMDLELRVQKVCREGIQQGWVQSAHDCAEGGLTVALAEACLGGNLGATMRLPLPLMVIIDGTMCCLAKAVPAFWYRSPLSTGSPGKPI